MKTSPSTPMPRRGFTIMETLLAIGIISVLLSIFLTLFLPAKNMVKASMAREESERLTTVLRSEMTTLRPNEQSKSAKSTKKTFVSGFDKAFHWMERSARPSTTIVIFSYRADLSQPQRADGSYPPVKGSKNAPSANTELVTIACPMDEKLHLQDIRRAVGPVFMVRMTQLIEDESGNFTLAKEPGVIKEAKTAEQYVSPFGDREPWGAVVYFRADFFQMAPPDPIRYRRSTWRSMDRPIFSTNMSFRR